MSGREVAQFPDADEENGVVSQRGDWMVQCEGWRTVNRQSSAAKNTVLALWVWPITILASTAGYIGDLLLDGVDSAASALAEGLIADGVVNGFTIFGASGSIVFGLLTWLFLSALIRRASEIQGATNATAR